MFLLTPGPFLTNKVPFMDVFQLRDTVIGSYADYVRSFVRVKDTALREFVEGHLNGETLWPEPLIQLNPAFEAGGWINDLVEQSLLHETCRQIFRFKDVKNPNGSPLRLHRHQLDAIQTANRKENYVLTTGTGSGKSLSYIVPIRRSRTPNWIRKWRTGHCRVPDECFVQQPVRWSCRSFCALGFPSDRQPVRFASYTGQTPREERDEIVRNPPDIILTNYVMLELLLTRPFERKLVAAAENLSFLVLDELHTYRGRQGADVAMLVRRVREACRAPNVLCVGTSATMATGGTRADRNQKVAEVASQLFGATVKAENVIGETLRRQTRQFSEDTDLEQIRVEITSGEIPMDYQVFASTGDGRLVRNKLWPA